MGMGNGERERVGRIRRFDASHGQQMPDHRLHLLLARVTNANHAFLHMIGRVFRDLEPRARSSEQSHRTRLAKLEGGGWVLVHESLFDGDGVRLESLYDIRKKIMQNQEARPQSRLCIGRQHAVRNVGKSRTGHFNDAPAHAGEAGIETEDTQPHHGYVANRMRHSLDSPAQGRNRIQAASSLRISESESS